MSPTFVVVADAARARVYTCMFAAAPDGRRVLGLVEYADLVNPERRLRPSQVHSETRPGTSRAPTGVEFAVDDHREQHQQEVDRRFAAEIVRELEHVLPPHGPAKVLMVASPHMLGQLRRWTDPFASRAIELHEVARDLTLEPTPQLHDHLAGLNLLPPRARVAP